MSESAIRATFLFVDFSSYSKPFSHPARLLKFFWHQTLHPKLFASPNLISAVMNTLCANACLNQYVLVAFLLEFVPAIMFVSTQFETDRDNAVWHSSEAHM
eukprot:6047090-Amphidinium_carterae.1